MFKIETFFFFFLNHPCTQHFPKQSYTYLNWGGGVADLSRYNYLPAKWLAWIIKVLPHRLPTGCFLYHKTEYVSKITWII